MGRMAELAAELEQLQHDEPCEYCDEARELGEQYASSKNYAVGSYTEKLIEAFEAGYKAGKEAK